MVSGWSRVVSNHYSVRREPVVRSVNLHDCASELLAYRRQLTSIREQAFHIGQTTCKTSPLYHSSLIMSSRPCPLIAQVTMRNFT